MPHIVWHTCVGGYVAICNSFKESEMKKQATLFLFILLSSSAMAGERVQLKISKPFALLTFLRAAANEPHISTTLISYVRTHVAKVDSTKLFKAARKFERIGFENNFIFSEYPESRQKPKSIAHIVNNAAVQSDNIDQFLDRIIGILPNEQWLQLKEALNVAEPFYDKMMLPYMGALEAQQSALEKHSEKTDEIFYALKNFYGSTWSDEIPFTISLFAIPGSKGNSTASPFSNSLALGVLTEEDEHEMRMGVAIHEICHVLYEEQPFKLQWKLDSAFVKSRSANARYAYAYFDEALATACGNGWAYSQLSGSIDTGEWYADVHINGFAKAIYPLVKKYIEAGKKMDRAFVNQAISLFEKTFPNAQQEYSNLLNKVYIYTDAENHEQFSEVYSAIAHHVRITSSIGSYPMSDTQTTEHISMADGTQLFVIHTNHKANYRLLEKEFPEIKGLDPAGEGIISFYDHKKRPVIILNAKSMDRIEKVVLQMEKQNHIDPKVLFTPLQ